MGWIVHRHGVLYLEEYGWDERFEALVAQVVAEFIQRLVDECITFAHRIKATTLFARRLRRNQLKLRARHRLVISGEPPLELN